MFDALLQRRARWYVYELIDPRSGAAFYVGKGTKDRIAAHERAAADGKECSEKVQRIKEIWAANLKVVRRHVAWFWNEQEAYDFEAARIDDYGLDALTNQTPGGGTARALSPVVSCKAPMEWTPIIAAQLVCKRDHLLAFFAAWIAAEKDGMRLVADSTMGDKWAMVVVDAAIKLFPNLLKKIRESDEAVEYVSSRLSLYGVELQHGRA